MPSTKELVTNAVVGTVVGSAVSGIGGAVSKSVWRSGKGVMKSLARDFGLIKTRRRRKRRR